MEFISKECPEEILGLFLSGKTLGLFWKDTDTSEFCHRQSFEIRVSLDSLGSDSLTDVNTSGINTFSKFSIASFL